MATVSLIVYNRLRCDVNSVCDTARYSTHCFNWSNINLTVDLYWMKSKMSKHSVRQLGFEIEGKHIYSLK